MLFGNHLHLAPPFELIPAGCCAISWRAPFCFLSLGTKSEPSGKHFGSVIFWAPQLGIDNMTRRTHHFLRSFRRVTQRDIHCVVLTKLLAILFPWGAPPGKLGLQGFSYFPNFRPGPAGPPCVCPLNTWIGGMRRQPLKFH